MSEQQEKQSAFRAQTIELFFDLVFVFTITQITHLVEHAHSAIDYVHAFGVLMLVWWMYDGYIWLTNHAHTPKSLRFVLVAAMAGFLVIALAIPESAGAGRVVFGLAYLYIVLLHFAAFAWRGGREAARSMLRIVPFNIAAALLVIGAGFADPRWGWLLSLSPALLYLIVAFRNTGDGFALDTGHFVERHGLLLIIVLGEIIIAVGNGYAKVPISLSGIIALALAIGLIAAVWWSYFDADEARSDHSMLGADNRTRTRMALFGFNGAQLFMIAGLILAAAGLKEAIAAVASQAATDGPTSAHGNDVLLIWGLALYFAGNGLFLRMLHLSPILPRALLSASLAIGALLNLPLHGIVLVAALLALLILTLVAEALLSRRSEPSHPVAIG
ncbi:low temperature requirement protein A [Rhizobium alvei]|uniref:Low temperature requirement protein A n=1 Tax=Rhizobium alvei TaxID=1132659 RepID=A0ABT8YSU3_9HYPH|nr:low temperature requirement protein A [Rhizobium alvei]MDO6966784.1 low temperature requirement protein A [Rhizobium alvei]